MFRASLTLPRSDSEMEVDYSRRKNTGKRIYQNTQHSVKKSFVAEQNGQLFDMNPEDTEGSSIIDLRTTRNQWDAPLSESDSNVDGFGLKRDWKTDTRPSLSTTGADGPRTSFRSLSEGRMRTNSRIDRLPSRRSISKSFQNLNPAKSTERSSRASQRGPQKKDASTQRSSSPSFSCRSTKSLLPSVRHKKALRRQIFVTITASLASLTCGFAMGFNTTANPSQYLSPHYNPWKWQQHIYLIGALTGSIFSGAILNHGRKYSLLGSVVLLSASWLAVVLASQAWMILFFHGVSGACTSVVLVVAQVYIAEIASPDYRGSLSCSSLFALNCGLMICFVSGEWLSWQNLAILGMSLSAPFFICFLICLPESPRFLVETHPRDAFKVLQWLRGSAADIAEEHKIMKQSYTTDKWSIRFRDLKCPSFWRPCFTTCALAFSYSVCGSTSIAFYAKDLFYDTAGTGVNSSYFVLTLTVLIGIIISSVLIDQVGRKLLLLLSFTIMSATAFALGLFLFLKDLHHVERYFMYQWSAEVFCVVLFSLAHGTALGPVAWVTLGESFPPRTKWIGVTIGSIVFWGSMFFMDILYHQLSFVIATGGLFWFHCIVNVCGYIYFLLAFRELKDHSIDEIGKVHIKKTDNMIDTFITRI